MEDTLYTISQFGITILGCSSIWFISRKESWSRWGYVLGLASEPFWFYIAWYTDNGGILLTSIWYTYSLMQGFFNYWIFPKAQKHKSN